MANKKQFKCWQLFHKELKDLTKEERNIYQNTLRKERQGEYQTLAMKDYGKRYKDLTDEERREFDRNHYGHYYKSVNKQENGLCWQMFHKKRSELSTEEKREYNKIMKARYRNKETDTFKNSVLRDLFRGKKASELTKEEKNLYQKEMRERRKEKLQNNSKNA